MAVDAVKAAAVVREAAAAEADAVREEHRKVAAPISVSALPATLPFRMNGEFPAPI